MLSNGHFKIGTTIFLTFWALPAHLGCDSRKPSGAEKKAAANGGKSAKPGASENGTGSRGAASPGGSAALSFARDIKPIMDARCVACHSTGNAKGGVALDVYEDLEKGRAPFVKWKGALARIKNGSMPPGGKVPEKEVDTIERWLGAGADAAVTGAAGAAPDLACTDHVPPVTSMRHLSGAELRNTIVDLFGETVAAAVKAELDAVPRGDAKAPFEHMDRLVGANHIESWQGLAAAVATAVTSDASRVEAALACGGPFSASCLKSWLQRFGITIFRRPLTAAEVESLAALGDGADAATALRTVLTAMLMAPSFVYLVESGGDDEGDGVVLLTQYELASRLSYLYTRSMPDRELFAAAAAGKLNDKEALVEHATRLLSGPRSKVAVRSFASRWLGMEAVKVPAREDNELEVAEGGQAALLAAMVEDVESSVAHLVLERKARFADLLAAPVAFIGHPALAKIYEVPQPTDPKKGVAINDEARRGLLVKPALVAGNVLNTSPVKRGYRVLHRLLCEELVLPQFDADTNATIMRTLAAPKPSRERWHELTGTPKCVGCHDRINALGFAFEGFDAFGRRRSEEVFYAEGSVEAGRFPVNAKVEVDLGAAANVAIDGGAALSRALGESPAAAACFARQWHRYALAVDVDPKSGCLARDLVDYARDPQGTVVGMMKHYVKTPEFLRVRYR